MTKTRGTYVANKVFLTAGVKLNVKNILPDPTLDGFREPCDIAQSDILTTIKILKKNINL